MEEFPEANDRDAIVLSGFVVLFCTAEEKIKVFLIQVIKEALKDAKEMNEKIMKEIEEKIKKIKNKENILN